MAVGSLVEKSNLKNDSKIIRPRGFGFYVPLSGKMRGKGHK